MLNSNSNFTRLLLALPLVSALIQLSGCATIFTGTTDTLKFEFNYVAILDVTSIPTSGGIDLLTGSLMKFSPDEYHVHMLKKGESPGSAGFERSKRLYRYALMNYRKVQLDIIHGGGEYLESLASALSGTRGGADSVITERALRNALVLLEASGAHDFIHRFNGVLAGHPSLRVYRM